MIPVIPAPFFTYSNKELTFDNSLYIFIFSLEFVFKTLLLITEATVMTN